MPLSLSYGGCEARFMSRVNFINSLIIVQIIRKGSALGDPLLSLNDERGRLPEGTLIIQTVDNDENTYSSIKAKQATVRFFSSNNVDLSSFTVGGSDEWTVNIYTNSVDDAHMIFKGFLVLDVASEPYETKPYEVELTATDNLGLLKDILLTDFNGKNPTGENKIIKYLAWALSKTNMNLPIYVNNNLFEQNNPGIPFYESCYLNAKTFEKRLTSVGAESQDCYTVLTKILANDSRIEQINGAWWIERIYEKRHVANYVHQFDYDGTYVGVSAPTFYLQFVDRRNDVDFINDNAQVTIQSPYKSSALKYNYDLPQEIVDNIDFSRGDLYFPLSMGDETIDGVTYHVGKYHIDDWTLGAILGSVNTVAYIKRFFTDINKTYEKSRYVVIEKASPFRNYYLQSNPIPLERNDKFTLSFDFRYNGSINNNFINILPIATIILSGDDGSTWYFGRHTQNEQENWFNSQVDAIFTSPVHVDFTKWQSVSFEVKPLPVSGELKIRLLHTGGGFTGLNIHFSNLRFEYIPYINGDYSKYSAEKHTVSQSGNYSGVFEDQIYINNSPKKLFKGALKILQSGKYVLAGLFYDGQVFPGTSPSIPSSDYYHSFAYQLIYSLWQQYRTIKRSIDSDFLGLRSTSPPLIPDLQKQFFFSDINPHVNNKYFILLHYEQDYDTQIWRAFLREVYDTSIGHVFTDPYEFKYITE